MSVEFNIVSTTIAASPQQVDDFVRRRDNLHRWASGLASAVIEQEADHWVADSPMGRIQIRMAPPNDFGVLDHDVTTPDGVTTHNAMRVVPAGDGSLLSFVLLRAPGVSREDFDRDAAQVARDLKTLRELLEQRPH